MKREHDRSSCLVYAAVKSTFYLKDPQNIKVKKFGIEIIDISVSGIKFTTETLLAADECFYIDLNIKGQTVKLCCSVVRIAEISKKLVYGAKFVNTEDKKK